MSDFSQDKIGKIVQIAKRGVGGEKENAISILKKICERHNLDFNAVMSDDEKIEEFHIDHDKSNGRLAAQVVCRYAHTSMDDQTHGSIGGTRIYFKTTKEKYIETLNAWEVLSGLFTKEKKIMADAFFLGFLDKHWLYYIPTDEERLKHAKKVQKTQNAETEDEKKARRMGSLISRELDDANIIKRLTGRS